MAETWHLEPILMFSFPETDEPCGCPAGARGRAAPRERLCCSSHLPGLGVAVALFELYLLTDFFRFLLSLCTSAESLRPQFCCVYILTRGFYSASCPFSWQTMS